MEIVFVGRGGYIDSQEGKESPTVNHFLSGLSLYPDFRNNCRGTWRKALSDF